MKVSIEANKTSLFFVCSKYYSNKLYQRSQCVTDDNTMIYDILRIILLKFLFIKKVVWDGLDGMITCGTEEQKMSTIFLYKY